MIRWLVAAIGLSLAATPVPAADPLDIGRMNISRQYLKGDLLLALRNLPQLVGSLVHGDGVGIDVPGPQRDTGGAGGGPQMLFIPYWHDRAIGGDGALLRREFPSRHVGIRHCHLAIRQPNSTTAAPSAAAIAALTISPPSASNTAR